MGFLFFALRLTLHGGFRFMVSVLEVHLALYDSRLTIHGYKGASEQLKGEGDENTHLHFKA